MKNCPLCGHELENSVLDVIWWHYNTKKFQICVGLRPIYFRRFDPYHDSRGLIFSWCLGLGVIEFLHWCPEKVRKEFFKSKEAQ